MHHIRFLRLNRNSSVLAPSRLLASHSFRTVSSFRTPLFHGPSLYGSSPFTSLIHPIKPGEKGPSYSFHCDQIGLALVSPPSFQIRTFPIVASTPVVPFCGTRSFPSSTLHCFPFARSRSTPTGSRVTPTPISGVMQVKLRSFSSMGHQSAPQDQSPLLMHRRNSSTSSTITVSPTITAAKNHKLDFDQDDHEWKESKRKNYGGASGEKSSVRIFLYSLVFSLIPAITTRELLTEEKDSDSDSEEDDISSISSLDENQVERTFITDVEVFLLKLIPLNLVSRLWGLINSIPLPHFLRSIVLGWYSRLFNCDLDEAEKGDLTEYKNLGEFFRRSLKPGVRKIELGDVVSPSDGIMVHFGKIQNDKVEQIKGVNYSLCTFLGPNSWRSNCEAVGSNMYHESLISKPGNSLYHCVIYLAPGDYHRFHSPADWVINYRRHFSGKLLSIKPSFMSWIEDLFAINERVTYFGNWAHGFFSMTAVGATNVGSVRVYFDQELRTNRFLNRKGSFKDAVLKDVPIGKGSDFGEFNLGSTIVLIFEAPSDDFACSVTTGSRVKYGQKLFSSSKC